MKGRVRVRGKNVFELASVSRLVLGLRTRPLRQVVSVQQCTLAPSVREAIGSLAAALLVHPCTLWHLSLSLSLSLASARSVALVTRAAASGAALLCFGLFCSASLRLALHLVAFFVLDSVALNSCLACLLFRSALNSALSAALSSLRQIGSMCPSRASSNADCCDSASDEATLADLVRSMHRQTTCSLSPLSWASVPRAGLETERRPPDQMERCQTLTVARLPMRMQS